MNAPRRVTIILRDGVAYLIMTAIKAPDIEFTRDLEIVEQTWKWNYVDVPTFA